MDYNIIHLLLCLAYYNCTKFYKNLYNNQASLFWLWLFFRLKKKHSIGVEKYPYKCECITFFNSVSIIMHDVM